jgi:uncharacterized protein
MTPTTPTQRPSNPYRGVLVLGLLLLCVATLTAQEELPADRLLRSLEPTADVNDFAGILSPSQRDTLEARCRTVREKTGAQIAVVTLKSLEGGQIDDFAVKLFERWGIGQKEKKNGLLVLVAIQDRKARIEVGYGLEPILPDALAGRILREQLFPAFRQQRYADGLTATVERIAAIVEKNEPAPANLRQPDGNALVPVVIMLSIFLAAGSYFLGAALAQRTIGLIPFSLLFISVPFLIGLAIAAPWAPILHVPLGLITGWFGWSIGKDQLRRPRSRSTRDWDWAPGTSTWDWGSASSSGWSGGGFTSGGSDWGGFGGGSSGGGGASGSW